MKHLDAKIAQALITPYPSGTLVDSHQFQSDAMAKFKTEFALDFLDYITESDPLHAFSLQFGRWIQREFLKLPAQIVPNQRVVSPNLRNDDTENQQWRIL